MAGDWIKMRTNLSEDPAVVRLASGMNMDRYAIVGRLHRIWAWANEHSIDGQCVPVDGDFLDSLVLTPGFADQLRAVGWLSGDDGALCFPNFSRHNGESAKARALDAMRKRVSRSQSAKCPVTTRTELGPEKRRGEKSIKKTLQKSFLDEQFEQWYQIYPRRVAVEDARKAYEKAVRAIAKTHAIQLEHAAAKLHEWTQERAPLLRGVDDPKLIPYPATWLNKGRYRDELRTDEQSDYQPNFERTDTMLRSQGTRTMPPRNPAVLQNLGDVA